jgi:hypothetical protein
MFTAGGVCVDFPFSFFVLKEEETTKNNSNQA